MAKDLKFVMLLDCYGDLLTDHQRNVMELYYCEDLSLAEIGDPLGITRQAVMSIVKRTGNILLNYEKKLRFAERLEKMKDCFGNISSLAENIPDEQLKASVKKQISCGLELL
ncbi:MAG: YlxM family DNA-binding protein [Ruminococcus flavefaciens]|nr:YlxM family DNA-binding protein [Ruminococcus flavefaciens]MCM1360505.1 YlxM family DNA-binding protein [Clostridiales bacterium]MCM1435996.1 YlxM family DNA-binding protein [Ruminococcus flavefaciens]